MISDTVAAIARYSDQAAEARSSAPAGPHGGREHAGHTVRGAEQRDEQEQMLQQAAQRPAATFLQCPVTGGAYDPHHKGDGQCRQQQSEGDHVFSLHEYSGQGSPVSRHTPSSSTSVKASVGSKPASNGS